MNQEPQPRGVTNEIEFPGRMHPILGLLAFLPIMAAILIALALAVEEMPPIPLVGLLAAVTICCVMLSFIALQTMLGGKLIFEEGGLKVSRFLSEEVYPWHQIDACKVTPATGTFGDDAFAESADRVGVGLFLRASNRQREHDLDADVIICAADKIDVQNMMRIAGRVEGALKRALSAKPNAANRPPQRAPVPGSRRQFQQRPGQAQPPQAAPGRPRKPTRKPADADPVAQFRNRAT